VRTLLDTHALLWLVSAPAEIDDSALAVLSKPDTHVWISAASAWEVAIKTRIGRLDGEALLSAWSDIITNMTAGELPIESADAILASRLPWAHRDPFDRAIVAQALRRNLTVATRDTKILDAALVSVLRV
jgi:PIN domain nuclease of toxin-antitoxin system